MAYQPWILQDLNGFQSNALHDGQASQAFTIEKNRLHIKFSKLLLCNLCHALHILFP